MKRFPLHRLMASPNVLAKTLAVATLFASVATSACGPAPKPVRVVLITLDTLRYDRVIGAQSAMPLLADAATRGTLFTRSYAATSSTQPTHATLFTGLHPWRHGVTRNGMVLPEQNATLAEVLSAAGFETAAAVSSFPMRDLFGWERGFDSYQDEFTHGRARKKTWKEFTPDWEHFYSQADTITDQALALIDGASSERQFFFFHYFDPHAPYGDSWRPGPNSKFIASEQQVETLDLTMALDESKELFQESLKKALKGYSRDVAFLDEQLSRLLKRLAADAEHTETHIIITADHGESFGDDLSFGHGDRVSQQQLHVPLIILSPVVAPGRRRDPNGSIDVSKTVLSLAGVDTSQWPGGRDLTEPVDGPVQPPVGMRRTYVKPSRDVRISGHYVELTGQRFYALIDNKLHIGNQQEVFFGDSEGRLSETIPEKQQTQLRQLFEIFEVELGQTENTERLDAESQRVLQALGYTR
ncbi:MAG: arylsulfatase A-like enzyme [Pseudohongiellaceae bacterium]|jgi:arylsulfatase A-like enzyme